MVETEGTAMAARDKLNDKLEARSSHGCYAAVRVLILFWAESDNGKGYREEGESLGQFLHDEFGFLVDYFPIPKDDSHRKVRFAVIQAINLVEDEAKSNGGHGLLIVHYGGHGDPADDKHGGEERRATWRPFSKGGPSVKWFKVQEEFEQTPSDVLLLLDCCHSAQAGRGRAKAEGRIELLAASGSREDTPTPGDHSFTNGVIRVMKSFVEEQGYVIIAELHTRLMHRTEKLWTVPFHARLRSGPSEKSIRLQSQALPPGGNPPEDWATTVRIIINMTEQLDDACINKLTFWLRTDAPETVTGVKAEEVLFKTARINKFLQHDLSNPAKPLVRTLDRPDLNSIRSAWADIQAQISQYTAQRQAPTLVYTRSELAQTWSTRFLEEMDKGNSKIVETLEKSIVLSEEYSAPAMIRQAMEDPFAEKLGIKNHLELRHIVCSGLSDYDELKATRTQDEAQQSNTLQEYKVYGENQSQDEIVDIEHRVALLAKVLQSEKSEDFRTLRLRRWEHRKLEHRFVYQFDIPGMYNGHHQTLYDTIRHPWRSLRPSLGQRFDMARCIANAVQHWHDVGWVHQGICSHSVIFFVGSHQVLDYSRPYLHGFDFSRPNQKPSVGRYVDDINFNVYRHPDRQGPSRSGHRKAHDLYSLGVVLLEIGLWRRAIDIIMDGQGQEKLKKAKTKSTAEDMEITNEKMKMILVKAAETRLGHYAGTNYQQAVCACLKSDFGVIVDNEEGSILARAVREKVLAKVFAGEDIG